jgi:hypothetical protein
MTASSTEIRLNAREHALIAGGGAGTLVVEEWERLLTQVVERGAAVERRWRTLMVGFQLAVGAVVVSAVGHLAPVLADAFRVVLFVAVFGVIALALPLMVLHRQRVSPRVGQLDLPLVRALKRLSPGGRLYLGLNIRRPPVGEAALTGALGLRERHGLVFAVGPASPTTTAVEVGVGTLQTAIGANELDPSVSGLTAARAAEAAEEGNPFNTLEMVVLKEAHRMQRRWANVERFAARENPPPVIDEVLAERSTTRDLPVDRVPASVVVDALRAVADEAGVALD